MNGNQFVTFMKHFPLKTRYNIDGLFSNTLPAITAMPDFYNELVRFVNFIYMHVQVMSYEYYYKDSHY